jgi:hypothetical protein
MSKTIVVLEGDQTGQELLEESLRVLDSSVTGVEVGLQRFDLSLEQRRATKNDVVREAADAMLAAGLGLKAATITKDQRRCGPNRNLRERGWAVIVRTGRRIPGVRRLAASTRHPVIHGCGRCLWCREWRRAMGARWRFDRADHTPTLPRGVRVCVYARRKDRCEGPAGRNTQLAQSMKAC